MKEIVLRLLFIILLIVTLNTCIRFSFAEDYTTYSLRFGPSIQDGSPNGGAKIFGVRREESLMDGLHSAFEVGGYVDNGGEDRKSSLLAKIQIGVKPGPKVGIFGKGFFGPCVISTTDGQLGGHFPQFCEDIGVGIRDLETFMSIGYSHISSAGIFTPNHGKDFLVFEIGMEY